MKPSDRIAPGPGQESVWDYPRPPRVEESARRIRVLFNGETIADTRRARRVLETSHPPVYYIPPEDVRPEFLHATPHGSFCEWKGQARYYTVRVGERAAARAAWSYPEPTPSFAGIRDYVAFYPGQMDACLVDEEVAQPQPGDFYGGWVTPEIVGPFKGAPGTTGW
jgi:uncharacterized protein (DUF427 family)